jgi:hypothetical protein
MFLHFNKRIVNPATIDWIDCKNYVEHGYIWVHYLNEQSEKVDNPEAINVITELAPSILEGEQAKYTKHAWALHNLVGHPMMQIFAFFKLTKLSLWAHDITVPKPKV